MATRVQKIKVRASVGKLNVTALTPDNVAAYTRSMREQFKGILDNYKLVVQGIEEQAAQILYEALEPTFELSKRYCPKDTGALVESGFLEIDTSTKDPRVIIGYAKGGIPDYAVYVHEVVYLQHEPPTRSKFLLAALEEDEAAIEHRIIEGFKRLVS